MISEYYAVDLDASDLIGDEEGRIQYQTHRSAAGEVISDILRKWAEDIISREGRGIPDDAKILLAAASEINILRVYANRYKYLRENHVRLWDGPNGYSIDIDFEAKGEDLDAAIDESIEKGNSK